MRPDVIVIGLGAVGSATLRALARRGVPALGIDRHHPPHAFGSSHGESRIMREAIGEGEDYVPLSRRSMALWRELEAESGERLFEPTGVLVIGSLETAARHHGKPNFLRRTIAAAARFAIPHDIIEPAEARRRHPALRIGEAETVYFEPGAGILRPERCIAASLASAARHGAAIRLGERVRAIETRASGVTVVSDQGRHEAGQTIVCAGAWTHELLGETFPAALSVERQRQHWFAPAAPELYDPARLPAFIWLHGKGEGDWFYGFPELAPGAGVKLARERFGEPIDPDDAPEDEAALAQDGRDLLERQVAGRLAGLGDRRLRSASCSYTMAPESRFAAARTAPGVIAASACSGHGFKHSPAIGEALAGWAIDGIPAAALAPFLGGAASRPDSRHPFPFAPSRTRQ